MLPAGSLEAEEIELTGIINKPLLLHLVGCLYYLNPKFNRKFK